MAPMLWHAMPPELNTARLMAGAGPVPMLTAATGWETLAASLLSQADDLSKGLTTLGETWTGSSSDTAIGAVQPMVVWLQSAAAMAQQKALRATTQAASYTQALATTPSLAEIASNHISTMFLTATNFFGINMMPIAFNETDYFVRMWNQAAAAMDIYQAQTMANTMFDQLEQMTAILDPAMSGSNVVSDAMSNFSGVTSQFTSMSSALPTGGMESLTQAMPMMQQLSAPLQQVTSMFSQAGSSMGGSTAGSNQMQMGLLGANPLSNHPLAGGTGATQGAGLLRGEALPGAGGTAARTPLLSGLIDKPLQGASVAPASFTPGASAGTATAGTGAAPMAPMAPGAGAGTATAGVRTGLAAPSPLSHDESDHEDWDDEEDW